jgi:hypothetical protein
MERQNKLTFVPGKHLQLGLGTLLRHVPILLENGNLGWKCLQGTDDAAYGASSSKDECQINSKSLKKSLAILTSLVLYL